MAHYKVSFRVAGKTYFTEGDSTYPSDEAIERNDIDMGIAHESAAIFASACKQSLHIERAIESESIVFEIYK